MPEDKRPEPAFPADFRFVDPHHHLWNLSRPGYGWLKTDRRMEKFLGDYAAIAVDYLPERYIREGAPAHLVKSVHIETAEITDPVEETAWLQDLAAADPLGFPHGIIAACDLRGSDAEGMVSRHMRYRNFRGIRMLTSSGARFHDDSAFLRGLALLDERQLIFEIDADFPLFAGFARAADRYPGLQFVLGNAGFPREREPAYLNAWREALRELAKRPNVACKISGLGMVDHAWTPHSLRPWVLACLDCFGPTRTMFASNWPVDSLYSGLPTLVMTYRSLVADRPPAVQEALFAGNAERIYRI